VKSLLHKGLFDAGVSEIDATGQRFDAEKHKAVKTTATADSEKDGIISRTLQCGYAVDGQTLRLPEVAVFTLTRS
jgi:molecular chaperone GrpE (heat shock protein)